MCVFICFVCALFFLSVFTKPFHFRPLLDQSYDGWAIYDPPCQEHVDEVYKRFSGFLPKQKGFTVGSLSESLAARELGLESLVLEEQLLHEKAQQQIEDRKRYRELYIAADIYKKDENGKPIRMVQTITKRLDPSNVTTKYLNYERKSVDGLFKIGKKQNIFGFSDILLTPLSQNYLLAIIVRMARCVDLLGKMVSEIIVKMSDASLGSGNTASHFKTTFLRIFNFLHELLFKSHDVLLKNNVPPSEILQNFQDLLQTFPIECKSEELGHYQAKDMCKVRVLSSKIKKLTENFVKDLENHLQDDFADQQPTKKRKANNGDSIPLTDFNEFSNTIKKLQEFLGQLVNTKN